ncbi:TIR domain-containing protein [Acinetobacter sp. YH16053]|uniref:TIR domain-containing protein n=1 Tax=Acinetobacter sp. YH16053 TaxID=2601192 RepID=UPI0015D2EFA7|nr:TIR domain-containing protein [Acinetobacter sp. YH16053]
MKNQKSIFISYSWDNEDHRLWVKKLADALEEKFNFHVIWDGYDLDSFIDKNLYMEQSVVDCDYMLVVATGNYKLKSSSRKGGVGIETSIAVSQHWKQMEQNGKTKIIPILKEKDAIPIYLENHLYIDFTNENEFDKNFNELLKTINGDALFKRPAKKKINRKPLTLTKVEEIISLAYKSKKKINEVIDYSRDNRIKYEIWEVQNITGSPIYFIATHPNINMAKTLQNAFAFIDKILVEKNSQIIILSDRIIHKLDQIINSQYNVKNIKYEDFLWNHCISEEFKDFSIPEKIDFYTPQDLLDSNEVVHNNAINFISNLVSNPTEKNTANLIIGSGGIGKTSLCQSLANKLKSSKDKFLTIYISSEDIRNYINENHLPYGNVDNIYDLYQMEAKYLDHQNIFDKKTFELSILTGKIVTIIDGLDEFASIFSEKFNIYNFLKSIHDMNLQLGSNRFVITSRENNIFSDEILNDFEINKLNLLGFKLDNCTKYLNQRFNKYDEHMSIVNSIYEKIELSSLFEHQRVVPFFVDVISTMYEDNIKSGSNNIFELCEEPTKYPSLNKLNDHLIYSIFRREKNRHNLIESPEQIVSTFIDLCSELGDSWTDSEFHDLIALNFEKNVDKYVEKMKKNPLLKINGDRVYLRYDFLKSYFITLDLFRFFEEKKLNLTFLRLLSRIGKDSNELRDLVLFLESRNYVEIFVNLIDNIKSKVNISELFFEKGDQDGYLKSIEKIVFILYKLNNNKPSDFNDKLKTIYKVCDGNEVYEGLFVNGDIHALNFNGLNITYSIFKNFPKFLNSDFTDSNFQYSSFENCNNDNINNSNFNFANIDLNNCNLDDKINKSYNLFSDKKEINNDKIKDEFKKFLLSFFKGGRFRDNNKIHISFSQHIEKLKITNFNKFIAKDILQISVKKEVDTFYEINKIYRDSVRKFIMDGTEDFEIKEMIKWLSD